MPGLSDFPDQDVSYHGINVSMWPTLREIYQQHRSLFHRNQDWFESEAFLDREAQPLSGIPEFEQWSFPYFFPTQDPQRVSAASLCWLYVQNPEAEIWNRFLWTDDTDKYGDRVYIGGKNRTGRLEIHRFLTIRSNFGLPKW